MAHFQAKFVTLQNNRIGMTMEQDKPRYCIIKSNGKYARVKSMNETSAVVYPIESDSNDIILPLPDITIVEDEDLLFEIQRMEDKIQDGGFFFQ